MHHIHLLYLVEHRRLELLTPTLPVWCATNCANAPLSPFSRTLIYHTTLFPKLQEVFLKFLKFFFWPRKPGILWEKDVQKPNREMHSASTPPPPRRIKGNPKTKAPPTAGGVAQIRHFMGKECAKAKPGNAFRFYPLHWRIKGHPKTKAPQAAGGVAQIRHFAERDVQNTGQTISSEKIPRKGGILGDAYSCQIRVISYYIPIFFPS